MKFLGTICCIYIFSCQYPVDLSNLPDTQKFLVIDAAVTEDFLRVYVAYSLEKVTSSGAYTLPKPPLTKAVIVDGKGVRYTVKNTTGVIDTTFKGRIGETYQLLVEVDGKSYESEKQTMQACPELDSLIVQYSREGFRSRDDLPYDGFDVYALAKDVPGKENYYQWHWTHYARASYCLKAYSPAEKLDVLFPCFPADCWNIVENDKVIVQHDKLRDGSALNQFVVRVPYSTPPNSYHLQIEQRAISPSVFEYLRSLETQTENVGTLFDLPAQTRFNPNVFNLADKSEKLLGVFSVYSYRYKVVYIDMRQIIPSAEPKVITLPAKFSDDTRASAPCTEETFRTKIKPKGWIN
ncbi:MAG: DUF4249 family protein [Saprospiraceae bacterium]|nr:DUF4249 family protein [Saprospiraceae bacterium]